MPEAKQNKRLPHTTTDKIFSRKDIDEVYALTRAVTLKEVGEWLEQNETITPWVIEALKQGTLPNE